MITAELNTKIQKAFMHHLIGDAIFSDDEKNIIINEAGDKLRIVENLRGESVSSNYYKLIVVAIVELTKEWDSEKGQWTDYIGNKLLGKHFSFKGKILNQFYDCVDSLNAYQNLFMIKAGRKYYASMLCHAFSPKKSLFSLLDLFWEIYCEDLSGQYVKNDPVFEVIANSLNNRLQNLSGDNADDDIQIGSHVYGLRIGVKRLIVENQNLFVEILDTALRTIDGLQNDEFVERDTYFKQLICEWWGFKANEFGISRIQPKSTRGPVAINYEQIKAKYVLDKGKVKLVIPQFRLESNLDYEPYAEVRVDGEIVKAISIPTYGSGLIMTTRRLEFDLDEFSFKDKINIDVEITHCSKIIYQSENSLNRDFILFENDKELDGSSYKPGAYLVFSPNRQIVASLNDIHHLFTTRHLYSFVAKNGDVLKSVDKYVGFEEVQTKKDVGFSVQEIGDLYFRKNGEKFKIVNSLIYFDVEKGQDLSNIGIRCNDTIIKLNQFPGKDDEKKIRFDVSGYAQPGKVTRLSAFRYSDNKILSMMNLVKFDSLKVTFDKQVYYGDNLIGKIDFITERFHLTDVFDASLEDHSLAFEDGEIVYSPPVLKWRVDEGEWHCKPVKPFFYKNITNSSTLEVIAPIDMIVDVGLSNNHLVERKENNNEFKIGQTIFSIDNHKMEQVTIIIKSSDQLFEVAQVYLKSCFLFSPISVDSEKYTLKWKPKSYLGEPTKLHLKIFDEFNRSVLFEQFVSCENEDTIDLSEFECGTYIADVRYKANIFSSEETTIYKKLLFLGNPKELAFKNQYLKVNMALLMGHSTLKLIRPFYISDVHYLMTENGSDYYSGDLFLINKYGERIYLDHMRDYFDGEYIKVNPVRLEMKTNNSCYLGYGLDLNDEDYDYENDFCISDDNKIVVAKKMGNLHSVDYFEFIVKKEPKHV